MSSANCFNLDQSKILMFGNGLKAAQPTSVSSTGGSIPCIKALSLCMLIDNLLITACSSSSFSYPFSLKAF